MTDQEFEFEERAAIIQHSCNVPREEAERLAREQIERRAQKNRWKTKLACGSTSQCPKS